MQAWNTLGHFLLKARKSIFHGLSFKQTDDHTCYIIKYSVFCNALVFYDKWNQELEQTNGAESRRNVQRWLVYIPNHSFSVDECGEMVLK